MNLEVVALVRKDFQFLLGRPSVVETEVVAGLEVHCHRTIRVGLEVDREDLQGHVGVVTPSLTR